MRLYLVGGFLGSGKTTAIIGAARLLASRGLRVGVVTNDQGRRLVDTAFMAGAGLPAVEVSGGCFCCGYDNLDEQLNRLRDMARPDIIFAEAVGSCADMVATVLRPLRRFRADLTPEALTVFTDIRLLRRRLHGEDLPFSDDVQYVFDAQMAEAGLLIINKADLLSAEASAEIAALARTRFPQTPVLLLSGRETAGATAWLEALEQIAPADHATPRIDYERYGAGERRLAWLDAEFALDAPGGDAGAAGAAAAYALADALQAAGIAVGHLKCLVRAGTDEIGLSLTGGSEMLARHDARSASIAPAEQATLIVNARAECAADILRNMALQTIQAAATRYHTSCELRSIDVFHPREPRPTHWMEAS